VECRPNNYASKIQITGLLRSLDLRHWPTDISQESAICVRPLDNYNNNNNNNNNNCYYFVLTNSVTLSLFSDLYIGLKSNNALKTNLIFSRLPTNLSPLLNLLICAAWSPFNPSWHSLLICYQPLSTPYIYFFENYQSLISQLITSSPVSTSCLIPPASHQSLSRLIMSHFLIHLPTCSPPSFSIAHSLFHSTLKTHLFPNIFSTIVCTHKTAFSDYNEPDLFCSTVSICSFFLFLIFYFVLCSRLSWFKRFNLCVVKLYWLLVLLLLLMMIH